MIFDFQSMLDKVRQLAEMAQTLRSENAALRSEVAALTEQNTQLGQRMQEAHERVSVLLQSIPSVDQDEEAA